LRWVFAIVAAAVYGSLGGYSVVQFAAQLRFATRNWTWIESSQHAVRDAIYARAGMVYANRYDIGIWANLKQRLGSKVWTWFLPVPNTEMAYVFPRNPAHVPVWEINFLPFAKHGNDLLPRARMSHV
jgi:hypothetical protein